MGDEQWQVTGSAAEVYQRELVPAIFGPWAPRVVALAAPAAGERALDAACGTGVVARLAAERVGPEGQVAGLDLNPGMLAVASGLPVAGAPIGWVQASAVRMPFPDRSFEVVCCQLGLQYFPDRPAALAEMARVLAPGGRLAVMVWRSIDHSPGFAALAEALDRHIGPEAGATMRAPFALSDEAALRGLVEGAGFRDVRVDREAGAVRFGSARELVIAQGAGSPLAGPIGPPIRPPGRGCWPRSRSRWDRGRARPGSASPSRPCWSAAAARAPARLAVFGRVCAVGAGDAILLPRGPGTGPARSPTEGAMSVYQPEAGAVRDGVEGPPAFRVVRRGYDREEVDAYIPQLLARLQEAVGLYTKAEQAQAALQRELTNLREGSPSFEQIGGEAAALLQEAGRSAEQLVENARRRADEIIEKAQQQAEQKRTDVAAEAQKALEQAREVAEHIRRDVEQERAALYSETEQVREFRDGLLDDLGRVHGEISGLLERTRRQRDQALTIGGLADPKAIGARDPGDPGADATPDVAADAPPETPTEPATVAERK